MTRQKYDYNYVKKYIEDYNYILLSKEYINSKTKLDVQCPFGHKYSVVFSNFKFGYRCPHCCGNVKYNYESVKKYIEDNGYKLISTEYKNTDSKLDLICPNGHKYSVTFYNFKKRGRRCPECNGSPKYDYNKVKNIIEEERYILLSDTYASSKQHLEIMCNEGHKYKATFNNFQRGTRCPHCFGKFRHSYDYVKNIIEETGYRLLSNNYVNVESKLMFKCPKGHEFNMNYNNFQQGQRCPKCIRKSKGELKIEDILNENNIEYISQYKYDDCRNKKPLPFDFYLPLYDLLIEYDGEQHFDIKHSFGDEESFWETVVNDSIKNQYCEDNNIKLVRIPFWEFNNIEEILKKHLNIIK